MEVVVTVARSRFFTAAALFLAAGVPAAIVALLYAPSLAGGFLGDDFTLLLPFHAAHQRGDLIPTVGGMFASGVGPPSHQYRPLTMLTFALSEVSSGTSAAGWRAVNIALHAANAALVSLLLLSMLVRRGGTGASRALFAAIAAGTLFAVFPPSVEAVAWIAARFDPMVLFWMLVSACAFVRSRHWNDGFNAVSLAAAVLAFMCKEAAAILPILIVTLAWWKQDASPRGGAVARALIDAAPWMLITAGYFALRLWIFGDAFSVLPGSSPGRALVSGQWAANLESLGPWWVRALPEAGPRRALEISVAILALLAVAGAARDRTLARALAALALAAVAGMGMLLLQLAWPANGEGGRVFYEVWAMWTAALALALASERAPVRALAAAALLVAVTAGVLLANAAIDRRVIAGRDLDALRVELARVAADVPAQSYAFVVVPDHLGAIPFARNAQAGLLLPPLQAAPLAPRVIVQTPLELDRWPDLFTRDIIARLRREPLLEIAANLLTPRTEGPHAMPDRFFCFNPRTHALAALQLDFAPGLADWDAQWRRALASGECGGDAAQPSSSAPGTRVP
ncbi:MAG: hypothetical protein ABI981_02530 [Betaproteobacteria bacterium]